MNEHIHDENCNHDEEEFEPIPVSDVMTDDVMCATADTALQEIARLMRDEDCGAIPIVSDAESLRPIGIITDRDITVRLVAEGRNPLELTARDAMSETVVTISPAADLEECMDLMEENQLRRVVVVDENGGVCGIIAQADIADWASEEDTAEMLGEISDDEK
ncbi:MAG TPA: CBS domain-containing protein [Abditibacteriaceae bacterium]|jgi:CBS domain-containing protein